MQQPGGQPRDEQGRLIERRVNRMVVRLSKADLFRVASYTVLGLIVARFSLLLLANGLCTVVLITSTPCKEVREVCAHYDRDIEELISALPGLLGRASVGQACPAP